MNGLGQHFSNCSTSIRRGTNAAYREYNKSSVVIPEFMDSEFSSVFVLITETVL
jgi:hypothetical protein